MYFRYVGMQFALTRGLGPFGPDSFWVMAVNAIPYLLLALGAYWNWKRDKKTFWFFLTQNFVMGPALIFYLNFTDHEVRERDYFFTNSYHFLAIWMGMGAAGVVKWLASAFEPAKAPAPAGVPSGAPAPAGATGGFMPYRAGVALGAAALIGISLLPMKEGWYEHDRSRFYIAHDYAYNMLTPLEPGAIVMTNGDNDTFPLWYIQEVEHVRRDVRVVNLGLLNKNRNYDSTVYKDDNAYKLVQNYSAAHVQVAYEMQKAGQGKDAISLLRDAVKMTPDFPGLLEYLGKSYQDTGDTAEAERVFTQALQRFPDPADL